MINEIEKTIEKFFPEKWGKKDALFWMGKTIFDIDIEAINRNINLPIRDFILRGGKRWRPILFLTILKLFGSNYKKYLDFAFFVECIHNGTLVADDIEDDASLRRGRPSLHKIFGIDTAINIGNIMYFLPLKILLAKKNLTDEQKIRMCSIYSEEMINVHFGQGLDIYWHKNSKDNISTSEYMEMCRLKTGSLARMSVRFACVLLNKSRKIEESFGKFAETVGIAFQIKDDVLDLTAEKKFGKSFGNDITEGKFSLPVILTLKSPDKNKKENLLKILKLHTRDSRKIKEAVKIIKESGAVNKSLNYADKLVSDAWNELEKYIPKNKTKKEFANIISFLTKRDH